MNIKKIVTSAAVITAMAFSAAPAAGQIAPKFRTASITASAAKAITYNDIDNFFKKYNGVGIDVDGVYSYQCVDLASKFISEVCGISNSTLNGYQYWTLFNSYGFLRNNFTRIKNTPDFIPQKGDLVVWAESGYNHIAIATGEGTTSYFYSYDQNWGTPYCKTKKIYHNYSGVTGVLRYNNIIDGPQKPKNSGYEFGTLWVNNDIYIFNNTQTMYKDSSCKNSAGTIKSGQQKKFTSFTKSGNNVIGRTSDGYYIRVKTNNVLNVNAYGTVNCNTLNVRKGAGTSYDIVKRLSYGTKLKFTKTSSNGNWGYSPTAGGWVSLEYILG